MALIDLPSPARLAGLLLTAFVLYRLITFVNLSRKRSALAREKGCLPSPLFPQRDRIFGWDVFKQSMAAFKEHRFLELSQNRFRIVGANTFHIVALGRRMYMTIEPENLKVIQAVEFKKWGLGTRRKDAFRPLLGDGRFQVFV